MNPVPISTTRRDFLKTSVLAGAALSFPAVLRSASPNSRVQIASIGCSGMAFTDIHNFVGHAKVKYVGLSDIDSRNFVKADEAAPGTPHFSDFRAMLEKLGDTVDAINIAVPDHMH